MYLLIIFIPFLSSILAGFFGRFFGKKGSCLISVTLLLLTFCLSLVAFYEVNFCSSKCSIKVIDWFCCEMFDTQWGFYFDSLTTVMLIVITSVSSLVHLYSIGYMSEDPHLPRFMSYLSIFTGFMIMLVTGDNLLVMFLGWEGVGLASYLLINFWFTRLAANKASIKAMLVNRVGDFGLALGIMSIFTVFKTTQFPVIFALAPLKINENLVFLNCSFHALTVISICLFIGAVGKSAQLGLHTWLPDAMEGPTPVSALIHAATMVTAGVFMLARCSPLFEFSSSALAIVAIVGSLTTFFAATTGLVQNDLKRVIAYSTCSQLGYMVFACGVSNYNVAVFHLMNHAFFKALLFLGAGSVIHAISNQQDMRKMGALAKLLPFTSSMMLIGSLSLAGFPFLTGFYSKDVILEVAFAKYTINGNFAYWLGAICVFFTSYYSFRLTFLTFYTQSKLLKNTIKNTHDASLIMGIPLMVLALGSIFVGFCGKDMIIGLGTTFWSSAIFILPKFTNILESEFIPQSVKLLPFVLTLFGIVLAFFVNVNNNYRKKAYALKISNWFLRLYSMFNKRWFFDKVYNDFLTQRLLNFGYTVSFKSIDKGVLEILGPNGITTTFSKFSHTISKLQSGFIYHYAFITIIGLTFFTTSVVLYDLIYTNLDTRISILLFLTYISCSFIVQQDIFNHSSLYPRQKLSF
uniref:NADH-ubiquinone oxidoreductase chain 5 n=1 Tax=Jaagichlorella hainangensis TaxID=445995 RepID=A0A6M8U5Z2_9CHLO|nr:NADH dehydrogenase subunit 5 [Jaagichlorella hainangensis]QKJ84914.1 NADH dehydrogenase subunit 5 [Jaagichlorella hainangensis]